MRETQDDEYMKRTARDRQAGLDVAADILLRTARLSRKKGGGGALMDANEALRLALRSKTYKTEELLSAWALLGALSAELLEIPDVRIGAAALEAYGALKKTDRR